MNECPQCSAVLPDDTGRECRVCGLALSPEPAAALPQNDLDPELPETRKFNEQSMNSERWRKIKSLFDVMQGIEPDKRGKFLANACGADAELRREVEKLLASFENAGSFMEQPAAAEVASMFGRQSGPGAKHTAGELRNRFIAGTILAGRFRIIGLLGRGGMGEVYQAEDIKLNQVVALKFLPDKLERDRAALDRFHTEVRTARQVSHPNVCRVFDIGEIDGRHFLSMEYIQGDDLSSLLRRIGRLPSDKGVEIARQLCFGLAAIHEAGILHRDLKPANVIIDSRGKARITDFGIAGLEEEINGAGLRVGTPAYMSPEQITGQDISAKSDIYSLGLLLYEVFTGKQAFEGDSVANLVKKHQSETPTNPSEFVKGIDPLVEQVIFRCLEKNPRDRPDSALHVALALPGGNPLEAAIAAGETPSPEMVAAAPKKGALRPPVALACLAAVILGLVLAVWLTGKYKTYRLTPLEKPPEALAERAKSILHKLGVRRPPADTAYSFAEDRSYYDYAKNNDALSNPWERLEAGQPFQYYFWYRQSPRYLSPGEGYKVKPSDPPLDVSGMANVKLDARGRLFELIVVPPQVDEKSDQVSTAAVAMDWSLLFDEAGLDISKFKQTESQWKPPVFADERISWEGTYADFSDIPIRIEAAASRGLPVYFQVVAPWDKPLREQETMPSAFVKAAGIILFLSYFIVLVGAILLARYNLKVGRGDAKGGFKLAVFIFLVLFIGRLSYADHVPLISGNLGVFYSIASQSLFSAALVWLIYVALEPYVRRLWAELLISWNRLLAGDFRDPMVGRDVLVGILLGLAHTLLGYSGLFLAEIQSGKRMIEEDFKVETLNGLPAILDALSGNLTGSVGISMMALFLLLLFYFILGRKWLSAVVLGLIFASILGLNFAATVHPLMWVPTAAMVAIIVVSVARFGLLSTIVLFPAFFLSFHYPLAPDTSKFYFAGTIISVGLILGSAIYGFYTSIAGQPIFERKLLRDIEN